MAPVARHVDLAHTAARELRAERVQLGIDRLEVLDVARTNGPRAPWAGSAMVSGSEGRDAGSVFARWASASPGGRPGSGSVGSSWPSTTTRRPRGYAGTA